MPKNGNNMVNNFLKLVIIVSWIIQSLSFNILSTVLSKYSSLQVTFTYNPSSSILQKFPSNETFNLMVSTKKSTDSLFLMVDSVSMNFSQKSQIQQVIYNFESVDMNLSIDVTYQNSYYQNTTDDIFVIQNSTGSIGLSTLKLIVVQSVMESNMIVTARQEEENLLGNHFVAIIQKEKTSNYMLPFNLISLKKYSVFVNYLNADIQNTTYSNEPFLPTFWNELGEQALIIPWLPYFSECTGVKKRILLKDLLKPDSCIDRQDEPGTISPEMMNPIHCKQKLQQFECLIEEYNVENRKRDEWYSSSYEDIFYLHPYSISKDTLSDYLHNSEVISEISKQMYQEVPVLVTKNININEKPKEFVFRFSMAFDEFLNLQIVTASLEINREITIVNTNSENDTTGNTSDPLSDRKVSLVVFVDYMDNMQKFYYLHQEFKYYIAIPLLFVIVVALLRLVIIRYSKTVQNFQTSKFISLVITPMLKGLFLSLCTMLSFILWFYMITKNTSFSIIATTFDGDDSIQSNLQKKYNGRIGLSLLFCGTFILIQVIKQTFKIPTKEQMKINLEDQLEETHEMISSMQSHSESSKGQSQRKIETLSQKDIDFIVKILQSRKSELLFQFLFALVVFEYDYKLFSLQCTIVIQIVIWILVIPLLTTLIYKFLAYMIFKDVIYAKAALIVFQAHSYCALILKADTVSDVFFYWLLAILSFSVITPVYLIKLSQMCCKMTKEQNPNFLQVFLLKRFNDFIKSESKLSYYEKGICSSSIFIAQVCSIVLAPFFFTLVWLSFTESRIFSDIFVNSYNFNIIVFISVLIIPALVWIVMGIIQWLDKFFDLGIFKIIELNQFTFRNRKVKWMSDIFRQNPAIADSLKEYEKFHFSSQLYFLLFSLSFAGMAIILGIKIIFQNKYICFVDPAMIFMFIIIWTVGNILSMIISFLALKFKFYEKKEEVRMRTKLQSIEKLLRRKEYTKYLDLNAVKEHFLYNYKDWVIRNIENIFTKSMFLEENGRILKKFKFYKNLLKRKNMLKKRGSISEGRLGELMKQNESRKRISERQIDYQIVREDQAHITVNGLIAMAQHKFEESNEARVIKISKQKFTEFAKPLLYYWFYTAKQNTLLKSLILKIKQEKLQEVCEFCNMDLDLENIEKHDIEEIINQYRVINVGKAFLPDNFVDFYRTHQEFITVCFQCKEKKLYLQKKRIKNIKYAKVIVMNWLIRCRSQMLHKIDKNQKVQDNSQPY